MPNKFPPKDQNLDVCKNLSYFGHEYPRFVYFTKCISVLTHFKIEHCSLKNKNKEVLVLIRSKTGLGQFNALKVLIGASEGAGGS